MPNPQLLHRRVHSISHFQVFLMDREVADGYPDYGHGGSLATFAPRAVAVSTAWDENGTVEPNVEITVTGFGEPNESFDQLRPVADGRLAVGKNGVLAGNAVSADVAMIEVPAGDYVVTVFTDALAPFTARRVRFHLMALSP